MSISDYDGLFRSAGQQYNIDPLLLKSVALVESGGNPSAISDGTGISPYHSYGLMQFQPATAASLGIDPNDPGQAIYGAARLLAENQQRYGSIDGALTAYHGGTNPANWGPQTRAYVARVNDTYNQLKSPMDNSITVSPLGVNPNDPAFSSLATVIPPRPGDNGAPPIDPSTYPALGAARYNSGLSLSGAPSISPAMFGIGPAGIPTGNVFDDPAYKDMATLRFAGGLASGNPATAGMGAGLNGIADTEAMRLQNNILMQRLQAVYGPRSLRVASQLIRSGMQPSLAYRAAGINMPPDLAANMDQNSQAAKPVPSGVQKLTNETFDTIRNVRVANETLSQIQQKMADGTLKLDPLHVKWYQAQAALGNPLGDPGVISYQQMRAAIATLTSEGLKEQSGVQTDKDAEMVANSLIGGGLTSNDQANQHFNYIKNLGMLEELGLRNNLQQAYANSKQHEPDFAGYEATLPGHMPTLSAKDISADLYADHYSALNGKAQASSPAPQASAGPPASSVIPSAPLVVPKSAGGTGGPDLPQVGQVIPLSGGRKVTIVGQ